MWQFCKELCGIPNPSITEGEDCRGAWPCASTRHPVSPRGCCLWGRRGASPLLPRWPPARYQRIGVGSRRSGTCGIADPRLHPTHRVRGCRRHCFLFRRPQHSTLPPRFESPARMAQTCKTMSSPPGSQGQNARSPYRLQRTDHVLIEPDISSANGKGNFLLDNK